MTAGIRGIGWNVVHISNKAARKAARAGVTPGGILHPSGQGGMAVKKGRSGGRRKGGG